MSWLHLPDEEILRRVREGCYAADVDKMKLYQGTNSERSLRERIEAICRQKNLRWTPPRVLSAYDGLLTGHTDGELEGILVEIKTVPDALILEKIIEHGRVPFKVYSQMNAYMLWGNYKRGLCIYEERTTGTLYVFEVYVNTGIQKGLKEKAERIIHQLKRKN
jgi:hypothetical protein